MNNIFEEDLDNISIKSTTSKSDIFGINMDKPNILKDFGSPINKDFEQLKCQFEEKKIYEHKFQKFFENNFKIKDNLSEFSMDEDESSISDQDKANNDSESSISILGKKTKRKDINCNEDDNPKDKKQKIFNIEKVENDKKFLYRKDYFIMDFKGNFLNWLLTMLQSLIYNCKFCKKFGKTNFHIVNRELYGGNPKEEANREFIDKTIEEVFTLTEEQKNSLKKISRQISNEKIIKKIREYYEKLEIKKEKDEKYLIQFNAIEEFLNFIQIPIKDALDIYYDSDEFKCFKSTRKIQYYDKMFSSERNRDFSLLEKNNFVRFVNLPYYSNKNKEKK